MKILMVTHGFPPECSGGTESYVLALAHGLMARGSDVAVLTGSHEGAGPGVPEPRVVRSEHQGIPVHRVHRTGLYVDNWEKSLAPEVDPILEDVLATFEPDLVHIHHWIRMTRTLVETCHRRGVPAVCTLHDLWTTCPRAFRIRDGSFCERPVGPESCVGCAPDGEHMTEDDTRGELALFRDDYRNELTLARRLIVPSAAHRDVLLRHIPDQTGKFRVVPHGNVSLIRGQGVRGTFPEGPLRIGHWGHLSSLKGFDVLLRAVTALPDPTRVQLEVFGAVVYPEERDEVGSLAAGLPITWRGAFTPEDLTSIPMDVAVIPSRCSESWSFVLDEAFLLGLPAIVPDRGALGERVHGAGVTFAPEDSADLSRRLQDILERPEILAEWRARIPALPTLDDHLSGILRVYDEVLSSEAPLPQTPIELRIRRLQHATRTVESKKRQIEEQAAKLHNVHGDYLTAQASMKEMHHYHLEKDKEIARLSAEVAAATEKRDVILADADRVRLEATEALERKERERDILSRKLAATAAGTAELEARLADARLHVHHTTTEAVNQSRRALDEVLQERDATVAHLVQTVDRLVETLEGQERKRHLDARPLSVTEPPLRPAIPDRLRILFVVHQYLPRHESGTEVYTHHLARSLSRDHEVLVLVAESDPDRPRFEERRRNFEGVPIHEVIHNYRWEHFRETYDCPEADAIFRRLLTEFAPDVVHVQHLHYFSSNFVTIAHSRGIPVVYTLHDYMLLCPRDGTLRRADGEICQRPIPIKCRDCISHHPQLGESPPLLPRALRPGADTLVPGDVARIVRSLRTGDETTDDYADAVSQRLDYLRHVLRDVDLFLSPSAFLKERFVEAGLVPSDRIEVSDNGYDLSRFPAEPAPWTPPTDRLRVGYVGTIAEHKGIHVLIEALNGITDPRVGGRIWGDLVAFFDYAERIRALICHPDTLLLGPFPNSRIDDVLQGIDLLVIPSLWFENSPLTVHEAAACGVPVLASDQGGLAEYVHPEVTGRLFRLGDADHLREQILSFLERPLTTFDPRRLPLKSIEDDAAAMTRRYRTLMDRTHRTGRALLR